MILESPILPGLTSTAPVNVTKAAAAVGTANEGARQDHKHDVSTAAPATTGVGTTSAEGAATTLARSDHAHQSNTAPANVTKATAAIGTSGEPARADHKHDVTTAAAVALGSANAEGAATSLARSDHVHLAALVQSLVAQVAADTTTNSTTFVTLLTLNVTKVAGTKLLILAAFSASNSGANNQLFFRVTVGGVSQGGMATRYPGAPAASGAFNCEVAGLAAGAHTVLLEWRVSAGIGQIRPVTLAIDIESASLRVLEVSK